MCVCIGDMTTNERDYRKSCLKNFNNHYRDNLLREEKLKSLENNINEEFSKAFAFNKIISHINEHKNLDSNTFEVTVLEAMSSNMITSLTHVMFLGLLRA